MNKIFRVIWNHATQTWTAVSELAKCHGKVSSQTDKRQFSQGENAPFFKLSLLSAVILGVFFSVDAYAWKNADDSVAGSQKDHPSVVVIGAGSSYKATADATHTVVIGESSKATTQASVAIGTNANASGGVNAVAIGAYATTSGENATSMGVYAKAGAKGVAIGDHTTANGSQSVALGSTVNVSSSQSIGIGNDVLVLGHGSIALGSDDIGELNDISETVQGISGVKQQYEGNWQASDTNVPYGEKVNDKKLYVSTVTTGRASIAIGSQSQALNDWTTVLGARAFANKEAATAIGAMAKAMGNASFAGGFNATAGAGFTVALGTNATASQGEATAIGYDSKATATNSTVLGYKANATSRDATALGSNATSTGESATSVGRNAFANGINSVAIGKDAVANRENSTSLGVGANATGGNTIAIGRDAKVDTRSHNNGGIAIGKNAKSLGNGNLAFGTSAYAGTDPALIPTDGTTSYPEVEYSMAIGDIAKAYANRSLALGVDSLVQNSSTGAIAIGNGTKVYDKNSQGSDQAIAIGFTSNITGAPGSVIVGSQSDVKSKHAVSLGYNADIGENKEGAVVLGANSGDTGSSATLATTASAIVDAITYSGFVGTIGTSNNQGRFVSIGNTSAGGQRKLINLAAGEVSPTSTEAINGSQLYALALKQARYFSVNSSLAENRGNNGATGGNSIAIGPKASAVAANGIAIGNNTAASGGGDIVIGNNITTSTSGDKGRSVLIGENVTGTGSQAVALGSGTKAAAQATAIGNEVSAEGRGSIALGADDIGGTLPFTDNIQGIAGLHTAYGGTYTNTKATTAGGIAIGAGAQSTGVGAAAIGTGSRSSGILSAALGPLASASADLSVAIGVKASATQAGGVALGTDSLADRSGGDAYKGYDIATNAASTETIPAWKPSYSAVSVGKSGKTRQIINVAAGKEDTDAVNVAQLKKARISTTYKADGGLSNNALNTAENLKSYEVKSGDTKNIEFLSSLDWGTGETAFGGNNIEILHQANGKFQFGIKKQPTFEKLTISNGPVLSSTGIAMGNKKISGLANGADAADAVNKGQLDASIGTFTFKGEKFDTGVNTDTAGDIWRSNATKTFMLGSTQNWGSNENRYSGDNIEVLRENNANFHIGLKTNATFDSISISGNNGPKLSGTGLDMKNKAITNLVSGGSTDTNAANIADVKRLAAAEVAKIPTSQPLKFRGDDNQDVSRNLGTTLSIKGGSTATTLTDKNIKVTKNTSNDGLSIQMAKSLTDLTDATFGDANANNLKLNNTGLTLTTAGASSPVRLLGGANGGQLTGLESRTTTAADYGTGTNAGRAATESAVKDVKDNLAVNTTYSADGDIKGSTVQTTTNSYSVASGTTNGAVKFLSNKNWTNNNVKYSGDNIEILRDSSNGTFYFGMKSDPVFDNVTVNTTLTVGTTGPVLSNNGIDMRSQVVKNLKPRTTLESDYAQGDNANNAATEAALKRVQTALDNEKVNKSRQIKFYSPDNDGNGALREFGSWTLKDDGKLEFQNGDGIHLEGGANKLTISLTSDIKTKLSNIDKKMNTDLSNINKQAAKNLIDELIEVTADGADNLATVELDDSTTDKTIYKVSVTKEDVVDNITDTFAKKNASNLDTNDIAKWKEKIDTNTQSVDKVENGAGSILTVTSNGDYTEGAVKGKKYTVGLTAAKVVEAVQPELEKKLNKDASNLSEDDKAKWKEAIDTVSIEKVVADTNSGITVGEVERDDNVKGKKYTLSLNADKIKDLAGTTDLATRLDNKANISLDNINEAGENKIKGLIEVKAKASDNNLAKVTKAAQTTGNKDVYEVEVTKDDLVNKLGDTFAKADATNITGDNVNKWKTALGVSDLNLHYKADNETSTKTTALSTGLHFKGSDGISINTENGGVVNFGITNGGITKDKLAEDVKTAINNVDNKANKDATGLSEQDKAKWKAAIDTTSVELVTAEANSGITVSNAADRNDGTAGKKYTLSLDQAKIKDLAGTTNLANDLANKADKNLGNIDDAGKTVIKNAAKSAVKVTAVGDKVTVSKETEADGVDNYKVSVDMSHLATKAELSGTKLKYQANGDTAGSAPKEVLLSTGLNFHSDDLSVTTAENGKVSFAIKDNAITADKIANNAVTGDKIQNGAVTENKLGDDVKNKIAAAKTVVAVNPAADGVLNLNTGTEGQATKYTLSVNGAKLKEMAGTTNLDDRFNGKADTSTAFSLKVKESAGTQEAKKWTLANNGDIVFSAGDGLTASKTNEGIQYDLTAAHKTTLTKVENQGITFSGDSGTAQTKKLGEGIAVKGGETDESKLTATTDKNIGVVASPNGLEVKLAKNLTALETVTASEKVTVGSGDNKVDIKPNEIAFGKDGTNGKGKGKITGLADPEKGTDGKVIDKTQAANVGYVDSKLGELGDKPLSFTGNDTATKVDRKLGETLTIEGEGSTKEGWAGKDTAANNLYVAAETSKLVVKLAKDLVNLNSVTVGTDTEGTKITKDGTTSKFKDAD
ncbi:autotransporter adhesin, partial [Actinobacillus minor NM305]